MGFFLIVGGCVGEPAVIDTAASPTLIDSAVDSEADDVGGDTSDTGAPPDDTGDSAADEAAYAALYDVAAVTQVGIEMTAAPSVTRSEPRISGRIPSRGGSEMGYQLLPNRNFKGLSTPT